MSRLFRVLLACLAIATSLFTACKRPENSSALRATAPTSTLGQLAQCEKCSDLQCWRKVTDLGVDDALKCGKDAIGAIAASYGLDGQIPKGEQIGYALQSDTISTLLDTIKAFKDPKLKNILTEVKDVGKLSSDTLKAFGIEGCGKDVLDTVTKAFAVITALQGLDTNFDPTTGGDPVAALDSLSSIFIEGIEAPLTALQAVESCAPGKDKATTVKGALKTLKQLTAKVKVFLAILKCTKSAVVGGTALWLNAQCTLGDFRALAKQEADLARMAGASQSRIVNNAKWTACKACSGSSLFSTGTGNYEKCRDCCADFAKQHASHYFPDEPTKRDFWRYSCQAICAVGYKAGADFDFDEVNLFLNPILAAGLKGQFSGFNAKEFCDKSSLDRQNTTFYQYRYIELVNASSKSPVLDSRRERQRLMIAIDQIIENWDAIGGKDAGSLTQKTLANLAEDDGKSLALRQAGALFGKRFISSKTNKPYYWGLLDTVATVTVGDDFVVRTREGDGFASLDDVKHFREEIERYADESEFKEGKGRNPVVEPTDGKDPDAQSCDFALRKAQNAVDPFRGDDCQDSSGARAPSGSFSLIEWNMMELASGIETAEATCVASSEAKIAELKKQFAVYSQNTAGDSEHFCARVKTALGQTLTDKDLPIGQDPAPPVKAPGAAPTSDCSAIETDGKALFSLEECTGAKGTTDIAFQTCRDGDKERSGSFCTCPVDKHVLGDRERRGFTCPELDAVAKLKVEIADVAAFFDVVPGAFRNELKPEFRGKNTPRFLLALPTVSSTMQDGAGKPIPVFAGDGCAPENNACERPVLFGTKKIELKASIQPEAGDPTYSKVLWTGEGAACAEVLSDAVRNQFTIELDPAKDCLKVRVQFLKD